MNGLLILQGIDWDKGLKGAAGVVMIMRNVLGIYFGSGPKLQLGKHIQYCIPTSRNL